MTEEPANVEEVSAVLQHFRPQPRFAPKQADHEWTLKSRRPIERGYSSVQYLTPRESSGGIVSEGKLRLTYLHVYDQICAFLVFEVAVGNSDSEVIQILHCSAPDESLSMELRSQVEDLCNQINSNDGNDSVPSLFSLVSLLLQSLNQHLPAYSVKCRIPIQRETTANEMIQRVAALQSKYPATMRRLLDIQTFLVRCAAASKNRSKVCAPLPVEFVKAGGGDGDTLARLVFASTNLMYSASTSAPKDQQQELCETEGWNLLSFLLSLPWTGCQLIKHPKSASGDVCSKEGGSTSKASSSKRVDVCICVDVSCALGDESPAFSRYARKYGTVQAYHGTKIENVWSILNHGLRNLSYDGTLSQNGAMMGEGVYLSTSKTVAEMFSQTAAEAPSQALSFAFQHEALLRILHYAGVDISHLDPLSEYNIACLPVFEATIIAPPPKDVEKSARISISSTGPCTRQEGKYFCTDSSLVRITKLHLRFEMSKKSTSWISWNWRSPLSFFVFLIAIVWAMME